MQTFSKKRIDLIIEAPLLRQVTRQFEQAGVTGYSVMHVVAGRGQSGAWSANDQPGSTGAMAAIVCIVDAGKVDETLEAVFSVVQRQIGFVTVSDVAVIRPDRF